MDAEDEETEEEELEVFEVSIKNKTYYTDDSTSGTIYECDDGDIGDEIGHYDNGVAIFDK